MLNILSFTYYNKLNGKLLESNSFSSIIEWLINIIEINNRTKKTQEKYKDYLSRIESFSEENQTIEKKELTKINNDFNTLFSTYYSLSPEDKQEKEKQLDEFAKKHGYSSIYSAANKKDEGSDELKAIANLHTYFLIDAKRNLDRINSIKDKLTKDELNFIDKFYPNLEKWLYLYDKLEEIKSVLNPTKEQREKKKLEEIKGKVNPKIKEAIDKISEDFRIVIENNDYNYFINSINKLKEKYSNIIPSEEFWTEYKKHEFISYVYNKINPNIVSSDYKLIDDYDGRLKKMAIDNSVIEIASFTMKMYDKLGGFISDLNKDFDVNVFGSSKNYNDIVFNFKDGSKFSIRNQIVSKFSNLGTFFYTYPTTFHNAFLPNGEKISNPNEFTVKKAFNDYSLLNKTNESVDVNTAKDFIDLFENFLITKDKNKWLEVEGFKIYVRKSKRYFNNKVVDCIDLATIEAEKQGTGLFTTILTELLNKHQDLNFYIENVLTDRFFNFFKKYGFVDYPLYPNCLIKLAE